MLRKAVRSLRTWIVLLALVWIAAVVLMISNRPERGTATVEELATKVSEALNAADSEQLAELVALSSGADEAAQATVAGFADAGVTEVSTTPERVRGRVQLAVSYQRPDSSRGVLHLPTVHKDNRWQFTPVALP